MDQPACRWHYQVTMKSTLGLSVRLLAAGSAMFGTVSRIILASGDGRLLDIFGYFTIQSNLIVAVFLVFSLFGELGGRSGRQGEPRPQSTPRAHVTHGAALLYILVTAIIYNVLLAGELSEPPFSALILMVNHTITPVLFLLDWVLNQKRVRYRPRIVWIWLVYPVVYALFASFEGGQTGRFRYFFLDFASVSLTQYAIQMGFVIAFFVVLALIIVLVNRLLWRSGGESSF